MAKLLPNGKQTFLDNNGNPLAGGKVFMYIPSTTTDKDTWQNEDESTLNVNPIILDAYGRATIYGNGVYRQIVKTALDVTIWDKEVAVYSPAAVLWGGTSTGTANNQSIALQNGDLELESGNPIGGQVIGWVAGYTNTGPMQITITWPGPSSEGPAELVKTLYLGPAPMEGGEIVDGNLVLMMYDDASGDWFVINPVPVGLAYVPAAFSVDQPVAGLTCVLVLVRAYNLPEDATGSYAYCEDIPDEEVIITIRKNNTEIGTVTFDSGNNVGTFEVDAEVDFVATDRLVLEFPSSVDDTFGAIGVTFKLNRSING